MKAVDRSGDNFINFKEKFPISIEVKIKGNIILGPEMRQLMKDGLFKKKLLHLHLDFFPENLGAVINDI